MARLVFCLDVILLSKFFQILMLFLGFSGEGDIWHIGLSRSRMDVERVIEEASFCQNISRKDFFFWILLKWDCWNHWWSDLVGLVLVRMG